jgi:uncharacterized phage-associated protein
MEEPTVELSTGVPERDSSVTLRAEDKDSSTPQNKFSADTTDEGAIELKPGEVRILQDAIGPSTGPSVHECSGFYPTTMRRNDRHETSKIGLLLSGVVTCLDEAPLFDARIEAWANGPVVPVLYARHRGQFKVSRWNGDSSKLSDEQRDTVLKVLEFYGSKSSQVLSDLTHIEAPWLQARSGLRLTERGSREITHSAMAEYYSSL